MTRRRQRLFGLVLVAGMLSGVAACGNGPAAGTPTPTPAPAAASVPPAPELSPGVSVDGSTVTIVGQGRSDSEAFELPAGSAKMTITACRSNQVMPFITLVDATGQSHGLVVDPEKVLKNLAGGSYHISAQANPDCLWQVVIAPE